MRVTLVFKVSGRLSLNIDKKKNYQDSKHTASVGRHYYAQFVSATCY